MHGNRDGGVGYSPNICQLFLAYLLDCLAILGTVCVHAGKREQTDAIYSQLDISNTSFRFSLWAIAGLAYMWFQEASKEEFFQRAEARMGR